MRLFRAGARDPAPCTRFPERIRHTVNFCVISVLQFFFFFFYAQDKRKFGRGVPERHVARREPNDGYQLLHTARRLRARPVDGQRVDDGSRTSEIADHGAVDCQGSTSGGSAGRVGTVRPRGHGHQTVVGRPKKKIVHRSGTLVQPVDIVSRRTHHVRAHIL